MTELRADLELIQEWVAPGARVLDLACGDGTLLKYLADHKHVSGYGLEINPEEINQCIAKGVDVIEQNIDDGLSNFPDTSFDVVIMSQALQALHRPDKALQEMLRVADECIITFPNFAYWKHRLHLGLKGEMPLSQALPHEWYDTPNIHLSTFRDFARLCEKFGYQITDSVVGRGDAWRIVRHWKNLLGETAIFRVKR